MPTSTSFEAAWQSLAPMPQRCLELAHASLVRGGLACGSVVCDPAGAIVAEGRNRAYDPPGGSDPLQGTPLAHAEMNALAGLDTDSSMRRLTIWSTQQPCSMCVAAIEFIGIDRVQVLSSDPSDPTVAATEAVGDSWAVAATAMFLLGPVCRYGTGIEMIEDNRAREPETVSLVLALVDDASLPGILDATRPAAWAFQHLWPRISAAAAARSTRRLNP